MEKIEVQTKCLRLITAYYTNTNDDAIHLETGISMYRTHTTAAADSNHLLERDVNGTDPY